MDPTKDEDTDLAETAKPKGVRLNREELKAMDKIDGMLLELTEQARTRVISWLVDVHGFTYEAKP